VEHFIGLYSREFNKPAKRIADDARDALERYAWPGNVRELSNTVERIMILEDGDILLPGHLPAAVTRVADRSRDEGPPEEAGAAGTGGDFNIRRLTESYQAQIITKALEKTRGNRTEAAKLLGLSRVGLYHQMKRLGLLKKEDC
jgi:two-component system response regulator HydG